MPRIELPHARVIAIESEREFGMSVLERLDQELKRRGDLFRKAGVQDLEGLSRTAGGPTAVAMPRIAADHRRVSGVLHRATTGSRTTRRCCSIAWCGKGGRLAFTCCSARKRWRGRIRWPAARWGKWRCASPCSAAKPTRI